MNYKIILLSSVQGTSKKSGNPYYMMTVLITVSDNDKVIQSYTTNVFIDAEKYDFVKELAPMTELECIFLPTAKGMQIIQLDIVG